MGTVEDVVAVLVGAGYGTFGTNIFTGYLPASPKTAIMVKVYGGDEDDLLGYEYPKFQVQVRNANQQTAMTTITAIRATLTRMNTTTNGTWWLVCRALHPPAQMGQEADSGLFKCYCDFKVIKKIEV
ncbi:MAG: minor capsid protein [Methanothrix sp.]